MPPRLGELGGSLHAAGHDVGDRHCLGEWHLAELDPRQLHQVVDGVRYPQRLVHHPFGDTLHDVRVGLADERFGEHCERPDGGLQLVGEVGDEVGAHGVEPTSLADVLDRRDRRAVRQRLGRDEDRQLRRPVQLERAV